MTLQQSVWTSWREELKEWLVKLQLMNNLMNKQLSERFTEKNCQSNACNVFLHPKISVIWPTRQRYHWHWESLIFLQVRLHCFSESIHKFTLFRALYRKMHSLVNVIDLLPKTNKTGLSVHLSTTDYDTDDVSESDEVKTNTWADMIFIKPFAS